MSDKTILTKQEIERVARLANLQITTELLTKLPVQLANIIDLVKKLNTLSTKGVLPTSQVTGLTNIFREDVVEEKRMLTQEEALANAKRTHDGYFVVDQVLDNE